MELAYVMNGGAPLIKKYQIGEAMATAGVPVEIGAVTDDGILLVETTTALDTIGVTLDTQDTLVTAQQGDNSDPSRLVSVIVNPDAVFRARLSGGAASGTALTAQTVTTASADGLDVTTGFDYSSPTMLGGVVWGATGANTNIARKVTSVAATLVALQTALPVDTVVGDTFYNANVTLQPANAFVQLTTTLDELDATSAYDTDNNNFRVIDLELRDDADGGGTHSFAFINVFDHLFASGGSI